MLRKTNIFYNSGNDSKFLTFSNYTECMTGNFLSTNHKLFPTKFICLYWDKLDPDKYNEDEVKESKNTLIQYLQCYYENKLAFLRDYSINSSDFISENTLSSEELTDTHPENLLSPLSYLFKTLNNLEILETDVDEDDGEEYYKIPYISEISEQDYKGTYTDTICIVDLSKNYCGYVYKNDITNENALSYSIEGSKYKEYINTTYDFESLYGWTESELNSLYDNDVFKTAIFDTNDGYYVKSDYDKLIIHDITNIETELKFNLLIPLFSIVNINYNSASNIISNYDGSDELEDNSEIPLDKVYSNNLYNTNVPLGIWISDDVVEIKKDESTNFAPVWSLVISSQFKPFPYGDISNINKTDIPIEFNTYAQIIANQTTLFNKVNDLSLLITQFRNEFGDIKSQISSLASQYNIGVFKNQLTKIENETNTKYEALDKKLIDIVNDLKWKGIY